MCQVGSRCGHVGGAKLRYGEAEAEDQDLFDEPVGDIQPYSGRPIRIAPQAIAMLDSGWWYQHPGFLELLDQLDRVKAAEDICRVEVACSGSFYAIADPSGELAEGEVFLQVSGASVCLEALITSSD